MASLKLSYKAPLKLSYKARSKLSYKAPLTLSYKALSSSFPWESPRGVNADLMGNWNETTWLPKRPGFLINNRLPSMVCVILCSQPSSPLRLCRSSFMMKRQGWITTMRSLFGGHRPTFGFDALPFLGVVLFPSTASCGSCVIP